MQLRAVDHVSFDIQPGEIFGLIGPNGAGKTSIISTIVTLEEPTEGKVEVFGYDVTKEPRAAKVKTGLVPQELINHGYFNVEEILKFHSGYYGILRNQVRIEYLLKRLQLFDHRHKRVKQLSGGMKRRLLIAKALVHSPKLLLLDEPTAGVDIELRKSLWEFVRELKQQGMSILLTTHYLDEAEQLCDRVGVLREGKLIMVGDTQELVKKMTQRKVHLFMKPPMRQINHPFLIHQSETEVIFKIPASMPVGELLVELKIDLRSINDLKIQEGSLEDAFRSILGEGL